MFGDDSGSGDGRGGSSVYGSGGIPMRWYRVERGGGEECVASDGEYIVTGFGDGSEIRG